MAAFPGMLFDPLLQTLRAPAEIPNSEDNLVRMCCGPGNDSFELRQIVLNTGDF